VTIRHAAGTVTLHAAGRGAGVELRVGDEGPGFPADVLPRAFQRFSRGSESRTTGGAGLGLAIVDAIVRAHGGRCTAANSPDGGAVFSLHFPAFAPAAAYSLPLVSQAPGLPLA
jgi:signal transduction histidine kinase